ncbi:MAG: hypothetical protein COB20_11780 [SAR86 cluster bacterium]|uniref:Carboxylesterase type B domain-containing protein n=1 Tax=SAR86 cluster bacterium TaxID=2030880 RepID=A0A2A4X1M3_9GAMM|nr:MAG: hypothetical protein COB20_11780 [SAR86 cluster bacterium]
MLKLLKITAVIVIVAGLGTIFFSSGGGVTLSSTTDHILGWEDRTTIDTRLGTVTGLSNGRVHAFLGLRYAMPPTGERRFLAPVAAGSWDGTFDATVFPKMGMQSVESLFEPRSLPQMSEDSLFLNVFTPSTEGSNRPVLFWIHGGSFIEGSANSYDGSVLAEQGDVVVVAINYRLGMFGFLDLSGFGDEFSGSASNGIRDQILALEWVRDNIADYGGDRDNVTIFGESAGGQSVLAVMSAPSADSLYHKAIVHSGGLVNSPPVDVRQELAEHLKVELADVPETLRKLSAEDLFATQQAVSINGGTIDGTVITRSSNDAIMDRAGDGVPLIAGSNLDEGALFSYLIPWSLYGIVGDAVAANIIPGVDAQQYRDGLRNAYPDDSRTQHFERIWTDLLKRGGINSAVRASAAGPGGWLYRFDMPVQRGVDEDMGAIHAAEIAFTFNVFAGDAPESALLYHKDDPAVKELAQNWSNSIIQFAKTGDPNGGGLPFWPKYTAESRETLILDSAPRVEAFLDAADRERWGDSEMPH